MAILTVQDLSCARGGLPILDRLSFDLNAGEVVQIVGPNGIGKTTLLRTLAGLQPPRAGRIAAPEDAIAYGGHADGLKTQLTAAENLRFWAGIYGATGVAEALAAFDLTGLAERRAQDLSAGQKRRLGLARLLVAGRPIWMLDEPTVSLDAASVGLFAAAIRRHLDAGGAALIATHLDLGLAARRLDLTPYRAAPDAARDGFDEAFL